MAETSIKNVTRAELSEAIYHEIGLSSSESAHLLDQVLEEISKALEKGETVKLSSFGTFSVRQKKMRVGRNPKPVLKFRLCRVAYCRFGRLRC